MTTALSLTTSALCAALFGTSLAAADEALSQVQLEAIIAGNTLYVDIQAGAPGAPEGGTAPIYYGPDGSAVALLPAGLKLVGTWRLEGDQYCIDWDNGPKNSCTQLVRSNDTFVVMDTRLGAPRGTVSRFATGNAEDL